MFNNSKSFRVKKQENEHVFDQSTILSLHMWYGQSLCERLINSKVNSIQKETIRLNVKCTRSHVSHHSMK